MGVAAAALIVVVVVLIYRVLSLAAWARGNRTPTKDELDKLMAMKTVQQLAKAVDIAVKSWAAAAGHVDTEFTADQRLWDVKAAADAVVHVGGVLKAAAVPWTDPQVATIAVRTFYHMCNVLKVCWPACASVQQKFAGVERAGAC